MGASAGMVPSFVTTHILIGWPRRFAVDAETRSCAPALVATDHAKVFAFQRLPQRGLAARQRRVAVAHLAFSPAEFLALGMLCHFFRPFVQAKAPNDDCVTAFRYAKPFGKPWAIGRNWA